MYTVRCIVGILLAVFFSTIGTWPVMAQHWVRVATPTKVTLTGISFFNAQGTGFASGDTILKTLDGGISWIIFSEIPGGEIRTASPTTGLFAPKPPRGAGIKPLYRTTDSGTSWQVVAVPQFTSDLFKKIARWDLRGRLAAVVEYVSNGSGSPIEYSRVYYSKDTGVTWRVMDLWALNETMTIIDSGSFFGGGGFQAEGSLRKALCGRQPSDPVFFQSTTRNGMKFLATVSLFVSAINHLYVGGYQGDYYHVASLPYNGLYLSLDSGKIFTPVCYSPVTQIHFTPDGRYGAAVFANADSNRIWLLRTTNSGNTWGLQRIDNADNHINAVHLIDSANIFLVGDGGLILRTTDGGGPIIPFKTLGVREDHSPREILPETFLYPNPATARVWVRGADGQVTTCTITDMMGRRVMELAFTGEQTVDVSDLAPGSYVVQCRNSSHSQVRQLMIVR